MPFASCVVFQWESPLVHCHLRCMKLESDVETVGTLQGILLANWCDCVTLWPMHVMYCGKFATLLHHYSWCYTFYLREKDICMTMGYINSISRDECVESLWGNTNVITLTIPPMHDKWKINPHFQTFAFSATDNVYKATIHFNKYCHHPSSPFGARDHFCWHFFFTYVSVLEVTLCQHKHIMPRVSVSFFNYKYLQH